MATSCAQKVLTEIWNNGILFSFNKKILFSNDLKAVKVIYFNIDLKYFKAIFEFLLQQDFG
jgi:protein associated with RNAse G/E